MKIGILFDLDGTLLDTLEDLYNATNYILRKYGLPERSLEEVRRFVGNGARMQITKALPGREDDPPLEQVLSEYQDYYNATCKDGTAAPYPGVMEALALLAKEYPIAVVSNKPNPAVRELSRAYFGDIYARGVSEDCPRKPAPDMVYKAMEALGVAKCVYVGDSEVDVATARNAGMPCLTVLWGFRDEEMLRQAGATYFCQDARQMPELIEQIIRETF